MIRALALDLATVTGAAWRTGDRIRTSAWVLSDDPGKRDHPGQRFAELRCRIVSAWFAFGEPLPPEVLVLEAPSLLRGRKTAEVLLGLRGVALGWAAERGIPVFEAASSEVRKWAGVKLGKGEKERAHQAARGLAREAGDAEPRTGDEADAYLLLRWFEAVHVEEAGGER